ncbi:hypothetical protein GCK32_019424, partial [Trichostrongylus colubriformis]
MCFYCFLLRTTEESVFCYAMTPLRYPLNMVFIWSCIVINLMTLLCYAIFIYVFQRLKTGTDTVKNINRSLMLIAVTTVFGWFST